MAQLSEVLCRIFEQCGKSCRIFWEIRHKNSTKFWRSEIRQEGGCGIVCRISCGNSLRTVEMKRTELIKAVRAGTLSNVTPMHPGQSRKQVPDNSGEKYFKWTVKLACYC